MRSNPLLPLKTISLILFCTLLLTDTVNAWGKPGDPSSSEKNLRINPDYKISRNSNGSVTVTSKNPEESAMKHVFKDFYADVLMAAYRKQGTDIMTENLRKKYYLSEDDCRREIKHAVNILAEWKIILRGDETALQ